MTLRGTAGQPPPVGGNVPGALWLAEQATPVADAFTRKLLQGQTPDSSPALQPGGERTLRWGAVLPVVMGIKRGRGQPATGRRAEEARLLSPLESSGRSCPCNKTARLREMCICTVACAGTVAGSCRVSPVLDERMF
jgi:hypothetical protein